jgi:effector-binding domain-containing protein
MPSNDLPITSKILPPETVVYVRRAIKGRGEIRPIMTEVAARIPQGKITGTPYCIYNYITDVEGAYDVEIGFPVGEEIKIDGLSCRRQPELEVLSLNHDGPVEKLREAYRGLHAYAADHSIISEEFGREVYPTWDRPDDAAVEIQFVRHRWENLLRKNAERVLGSKGAREILEGEDRLSSATTAEERFRWVKGVLEKLEATTTDDQRHEILTGCTHVFPDRHIQRLRAVFLEAMSREQDRDRAIDAVLAYRASHAPWNHADPREGSRIICTKSPRDPEAHAKATTAEEKRRAYCFCPIIRDRLDQGMPASFCYCGAGWERRQWAGALGEPVRVRVLHSVLRGDDVCSFAVELGEG